MAKEQNKMEALIQSEINKFIIERDTQFQKLNNKYNKINYSISNIKKEESCSRVLLENKLLNNNNKIIFADDDSVITANNYNNLGTKKKEIVCRNVSHTPKKKNRNNICSSTITKAFTPKLI